MQAILLCILPPILPFLLWKAYHKNRKLTSGEIFVRYGTYALCMTVITSAVMAVLCEEGTSFWQKMDSSAGFVLKFTGIQLGAAVLVAFLEWLLFSGKVVWKIDRENLEKSFPVRFTKRFLMPYGIYLFAAVLILLNVALLFDNVVWGDEAYSANTVRHDVAGVMQITTLLDSHPPFYYLWLRFWVWLLGYSGWVMHFASVLPFCIGIVTAVTLLRKHFGKLPAAFYMVISGLGAACVEYHLEIRMYELTFLAMALGAYCSYRVISGGRLAWAGMVFWTLVAAYSHYYGLMAGGILVAVTGGAVMLRYGKKSWKKSLLALAAFIVGYLPWLQVLLRQTDSVSNNWWNTDILSLNSVLEMLLCGHGFRTVLTVLILLIVIFVLIGETSVLKVEKQGEQLQFSLNRPRLKGWTDNAWGCGIVGLTVIGTLMAAYLLCVLISPILVERYLYPLIALTAVFLCMGISELLQLCKSWEKQTGVKGLTVTAKLVFGLLFLLLLLFGIKNYGEYSSRVLQEKKATEQTLEIIGTPDKDAVFLNDSVKHLGWTILQYYYPENEVENDSWDCVDFDDYWYFRTAEMTPDMLQQMESKGYSVEDYGWQQMSKYEFVMYHFQR